MDAERRSLSTAQVARALGLSVTTVKRWVDDGVLPATRTVGGHRKILVGDVVRLAREGRLPQADISKLLPAPRDVDLSNCRALVDQLEAAVRDGDLTVAQGLLHGAYRNGFPLDALADQVIRPVLEEVGRQWQCGRIGVMHEHRATQTIVGGLYDLQAGLPAGLERNRPVALGGAPEFDLTVVPTLLARMVLLDAGWDALNLGPNTPTSAFVAAMDEFRPRLVWVCVTHLRDPDYFLEEHQKLYREAEARKIAVAVGGRALTKELRERMSYTTFGDGMIHLAAFARTLYQRPGIPKKGRPRLDRNDER